MPTAHRQSLTKAGESDAGVMSRMSEHEEGFKGLAIDAAALRMPRLQVTDPSASGLCPLNGVTCSPP